MSHTKKCYELFHPNGMHIGKCVESANGDFHVNGAECVFCPFCGEPSPAWQRVGVNSPADLWVCPLCPHPVRLPLNPEGICAGVSPYVHLFSAHQVKCDHKPVEDGQGPCLCGQKCWAPDGGAS